MNWWNCKRVARLLPLQIAGDLEGSRERSVLRHLATCEDCRRLADDFAESRGLLGEACRLPEFNSVFYSEIRNSVLAEIARQGRSTTPGFQRRWLWATALAALVITFGVLLTYVNRADNTAVASLPPVEIEQVFSEKFAPTPAPSKDGTSLVAGAGQHKQVARSKAAVEKMQDRHAPLAEAMASVNVPGPTAADAATALAASTVSRPAPVSASHVSRIEIQTSNPNIRIIWLTAQAPAPAERVDHAQDQDESGDLR